MKPPKVVHHWPSTTAWLAAVFVISVADLILEVLR